MNKIIFLFFLFLFFACKTDPLPELANKEGWTVYDTSNTNLIYNVIRNIRIDRDNNIWINNFSVVLVKFDSSNSLNYTIPGAGGDPLNYADHLTIDSYNNKWVHNFENGLMKFNGDWKTFPPKTDTTYPRNAIRIREDNIGNLWIINNRLYKYNQQKFELFNYEIINFPKNQLKDFAIDKNNNTIWLITNPIPSLVLFKNNELKTYTPDNSGMPNKEYFNIEIDNDGVKWLRSKNELISFDGNVWRVHKPSYPALENSLNTYIFDIHIDKNNTIWIATDKLGIIKYGQGKWDIINTRNSGLPSDTVLSITSDQEGNLWIGTNKGLAKYNFNYK